MKRLRVWLLLLLMLLLPIRGAMAAAMLCLPQNGAGISMAHALEAEPSGHDHAAHGHGQHAAVDATAPSHDEGPASLAADDCNLCASFCSLTPLAATVPDLRPPAAQAALNPASPVLAPGSVLDREDRPPRSI